MPPERQRLHQPVTLMQAAESSPTLAGLAALARESGERLKAVENLLPPALRRPPRPPARVRQAEAAELDGPVQGPARPPATFTLGAQSCNGTTDATGAATCSIANVSGQTLGSKTLSAAFAGGKVAAKDLGAGKWKPVAEGDQ